MNKINQALMRIPNGVITLVSLLSGIATIISTIYTIWKTAASVQQGVPLESAVLNGCNLLTVIMFLFAILCSVWMIKYKKHIITIISATTRNSLKMQSAVKDAYYELLKYHKSNDNDTVYELTKIVERYCVNILDSICEVLCTYTGKRINGCIKIIEKGNLQEPLTYDNAFVSTLCRSSNIDLDRKNGTCNEPVKISQNTDFSSILYDSTSKGYFYQADLVKYDLQLQAVHNGIGYQNTTLNWKQYYRGTIVYPVSMKSDKLFFQPELTGRNEHIIAFLCFDSMSTDVFKDINERYIVDFVAGAAEVVYLILNQFSYYLKKVRTNENLSNNL